MKDIHWFVLIAILALILGGFFGWNLAYSHWERVYIEDLASFKADIEERYGLREIDDMPTVFTFDLVGEDEQP